MRNDYQNEMRIVGIRRNSVTTATPFAMTGVQTLGYRHLVFQMQSDFSGAGKSFVVDVQDSQDNSNWANSGFSTTFSGSEQLTSCTVLVDCNKHREYVRLNLFCAISCRAGQNCMNCLFNIIIAGQEHHARWQMIGCDLMCNLLPIHLRHIYIHNSNHRF